jgi:uncharacterized protein
VGALIASPLAAQPEFPALTGRVVDNANLLSPAEESELTAKLEALEAQTQRQLVVATVLDLQGYDIADYGYQLGRAWGIGDAERNDGALLLVAPNERKVRIEVGYGLEGYLTDAMSSIIIQNMILPRFRDGDYPGGIMAGADAIIAQLQMSPEEAAQAAQAAAEQRESSKGGFPVGALIWLGFLFFFFVLPIIRGVGKARRYRTKGKGPWGERSSSGVGDAAASIILWEIGKAIASSGGSGGGGGGWSGGGGGFSGGGGVSGGGGSCGGGGASGGW